MDMKTHFPILLDFKNSVTVVIIFFLSFFSQSTFKGTIFEVTDIFLQVLCVISVLDPNKKKRH